MIVRKRDGFSTGAVGALTFSRRYRKNAGKSQFSVFVMLDDLTDTSSALTLVGRGSIRTPRKETARPQGQRTTASVISASAWIDMMPNSEYGTFYASVTCSAIAGTTYRLVEVEPNDFTGKAFGLQLTARAPDTAGIWTETVVPFSRAVKKGEQFDHLMLTFEGETIVVPIEIVH